MVVTERLLNVQEAAEILGVTPEWFYRNRHWKQLPYIVVLSPRKIRISLTGLLQWVEEQRRGRQNVPAE